MDQQFAMRCFLRVAATGSFAAAARELDRAPSVVTKTVQQLEDWTGSRLFSRTTRQVSLTEAGERFQAYCERVLEETDALLDTLRSTVEKPSGRLVVAAPVSLTLGMLSPYFQAFQELYPEVELELRLSDRATELVREGVDVALRGRAQLDDSELVAIPLFTMERVLCAAPAYWRRHGELPQHPCELRQHNCLVYLLGSDASTWHFVREGEQVRVDVRGTLRSDNSLMLIDGLRAGRGVGLVPRVLVARDLAEGRLVAALTDWQLETRQLFAVYPSRQHMPARLKVFLAFLRERLADGDAV
jgi:DNA-binding transcriptional LysR family regulator